MFKPMMLKTSLCDYSDAYILAKERITVPNTAAERVAANNGGMKELFLENSENVIIYL